MTKPTKQFNMGFLLMPNFSLLTFSALVEPLRIANRITEQELFSLAIYTPEDTRVAASNAITVEPTKSLANTDDLDGLIIIASEDAKHYHSQKLTRVLKTLKHNRILLGGASGGVINLAMAGVIGKHTCTTHWQLIDTFKEEYPQLSINSDIYHYDSRLVSCAGGTAALDMMLHFIADKCGEQVAKNVAAQCIHDEIRPATQEQSFIPGTNVLIDDLDCKRLAKAIAVMKNNIEHPLTCKEIAANSGFSLRQMERKFKQKLEQSPNQFYVNMRLNKAKALIEQSDMRLIDISIACGFLSPSHFTQCYKRVYNCLPSHKKAQGRCH